MPSSTRGSLSIASTRRPLSASAATAGSGAPGSAAGATPIAPRGATTENTEPRPGHERTAIGWPSTRPSRSTIDRPRPRPRAARAPCSSRWNSSNTSRCWLAGMPRPVSHTSIRTWPPTRRRQPTTTRPFGVYLSALETRFCSSRRISRRSERTTTDDRLETQRQSLGARRRRELDLELAEHVGDREIGDLRPRRAGVEARDVEQRREDLLDRLERRVDVAHQRSALLHGAVGGDLASANWRRAAPR